MSCLVSKPVATLGHIRGRGPKISDFWEGRSEAEGFGTKQLI